MNTKELGLKTLLTRFINNRHITLKEFLPCQVFNLLKMLTVKSFSDYKQ